jgi:hypothetical protein
MPLFISCRRSGPSSSGSGNGMAPNTWGTERARIQASLEQLPGKQMVIVRYTPNHYPLDEWVYNGADIDNSKVVWAREMDAADNKELIDYYRDRKVWLVEPDLQPATVSPYPSSAQPNPATPESIAGLWHRRKECDRS